MNEKAVNGLGRKITNEGFVTVRVWNVLKVGTLSSVAELSLDRVNYLGSYLEQNRRTL